MKKSFLLGPVWHGVSRIHQVRRKVVRYVRVYSAAVMQERLGSGARRRRARRRDGAASVAQYVAVNLGSGVF